jgi:cell division protein FtsB
MDPELREYLEAMEQRLATKADLDDLRQQMATKADLDQMRTELRAEIRSVDSGLRAYIEREVLPPIRKIAEGHQMLRDHIDRRFDEYDRGLADRHIGPLEAAVGRLSEDVAQVKRDVADLRRTDADHEGRIAALERRPQA